MSAENKEVAVQAQESTAVTTQTKQARFSPEQIAAADLDNGGDMPVLSQAAVMPIPLSVEYWSPENAGETKNVFIIGVEPQEIADMETGELKLLDTVLFVEQTESGELKRYMNSGKVFVANIKAAIQRGEIVPKSKLTPVRVIYEGSTKNRSNARMSKRFSIMPLMVG